MHNLGEGLAIGTSFAIGELQLGSFLVIGFMVHNLTEGLGIAAPAASARPSPTRVAVLALVAGAPTILGAWIGGYATNELLAVLFFAIAAGAALQVVVEVGRWLARTRTRWAPLRLGDRRLRGRHRCHVRHRRARCLACKGHDPLTRIPPAALRRSTS